MNRSSIALLGSVVLTTAGMLITASAPSTTSIAIAKATTTAENPAEPKLLAAQPIRKQTKDDTDVQALPNVMNTVLKDAAQRTGLPMAELSVTQVKKHTWSDGCLGLGGAGVSCTQGLVPGWEVTVASGEKSWSYRTNVSGTIVKWDEAASQSAIAQTTTPTTSTPTRTQQPLPLRLVQPTEPPSRSEVTRPSTSQPTPKPSPQQAQRSQPSNQQAQRSQTTRVSFQDVPANYWAKDFIAQLAQKEIIKGYKGLFRPSEPVTRGELAAMLSLAFNKPTVRDAVDFKDVLPTEWVHSYIQDAYQRGFIELDPDNVVNPNKKVSRLDVLVALARGLDYSPSGSPDKVLQAYKDASSIPKNARNLVTAATEQRLVVNYPNIKLLKPNQIATRAEVAALIYQGMVSTGEAVRISSPYVVGKPKSVGATQGTNSSRRTIN